MDNTEQPKQTADQSKIDSQELVKLLKSRLTLSKKFSKKWQDQVKTWLADYSIDSFDKVDHEDLYNKLQIPYIFSTVESNMPAIFESMPQLIMTHRGKRDEDFTEWVEQVWDYLVERLHLEEKIEDGGIMLLITGMMSYLLGWNTETEEVEEPQQLEIKDDLGNVVGSQETVKKYEVITRDLPFVCTVDYNRIYFSPESKFVVDDEDNRIPYVIIHEVMSPDEVEEKFKVRPTENAYFDVGSVDKSMKIDDPDLCKDDLKRVDVYKYYGQLPKDKVSDNWKSCYVYYTAFAGDQLLKKPERMVKKPIVLQGNYGTPNSFMRFGEPKVLRELEQDISLGRSKIADYRDRADTKIWMPRGTEVDEDALRNARKFAIIRGTTETPPQYITPPPLPPTINESIGQDRTDIQMASAQLDISRGGDTNTVQTATGQQMFQNAINLRINRKKKKIGDVIKALAKQLLMECANHWSVEDFAKITDEEVNEVTPFVEKLKELGNDYDVDIEVETIMTNRATRSAQAIALYKEVKDDPLTNREEILKFLLETGFGRKDPDRFINSMVTPDQVKKVLDMLIQSGAIDPTVAQNVLAQMAGGNIPVPGEDNGANGEDNPIPTDETALNAQANSSEVPDAQPTE